MKEKSAIHHIQHTPDPKLKNTSIFTLNQYYFLIIDTTSHQFQIK